MQSFLKGLNYYSRFIEDFAIYASVLYEFLDTTLRSPQKLLARLIDKFHLSHTSNSRFTLKYKVSHDIAGISMSSI